MFCSTLVENKYKTHTPNTEKMEYIDSSKYNTALILQDRNKSSKHDTNIKNKVTITIPTPSDIKQ